MNSFSLAAASIRARPFQSALCVTAAAAGVALLCAVFLLSQAVGDGFARNARGIDIVAGAKGSPLQLVLSSVYHADVPTGNIEETDAAQLIHNPQVREAIPLALGDNYKGWRIVGTTPGYLDLYRARFSGGRVWRDAFEAVAGAATGLRVGEEFAGVHGLAAGGDDVHDYHLYRITGVLKPTGTVLDRLILTSVESVQELHAHPAPDDPDAAEDMKTAHQVTALLLRVKSPVAVMNLPRSINRSTSLQAASPAYEMTRLLRSLGFGRDLLGVLGIGFVALSALMLMSTLASGLAARRYDLAVLRVLGASPRMLAATIMAEGLLLGLGGAFCGVVSGHVLAFAAAGFIASLKGMVLPAALLKPHICDAALLMAGGAVAGLAGLIPALTAARLDIAALLARGRA